MCYRNQNFALVSLGFVLAICLSVIIPKYLRFNTLASEHQDRTWGKKYSYTWTIRNFNERSKSIGFELNQLFPVKNYSQYQWLIALYPNGYSDESKDFVGVFLRFISNSTASIFVRCSISIRDSNNQVLSDGTFDHVFSEHSRIYGYPYFLRNKYLSSCVRDGIVKIRVEACIRINSHESEPDGDKHYCFSKNKLIHDLDTILKHREFTDVIMHAKYGWLKAHKAILAARSPVFSKQISKENVSVIDVSEFSIDIIKLLLDFIYTGDTDLQDVPVAMELLKAADMYQLEDLKDICSDFLDLHMNLNNVVEILLLADRYHVEELKRTAMEYVSKNFDKFSKREHLDLIGSRKPDILKQLLEKIPNS